MDVTNLTSADIAKLSKFIAKREDLEKKISEINNSIVGLASASSATSSRPGRKPAPNKATSKARKSGLRGKVKDGVLKALAAAGEEGLSVKEIAAKLKTGTSNIHSFFQTTGKKIPGIQKAGRARYTYKNPSEGAVST